MFDNNLYYKYMSAGVYFKLNISGSVSVFSLCMPPNQGSHSVINNFNIRKTALFAVSHHLLSAAGGLNFAFNQIIGGIYQLKRGIEHFKRGRAHLIRGIDQLKRGISQFIRVNAHFKPVGNHLKPGNDQFNGGIDQLKRGNAHFKCRNSHLKHGNEQFKYGIDRLKLRDDYFKSVLVQLESRYRCLKGYFGCSKSVFEPLTTVLDQSVSEINDYSSGIVAMKYGNYAIYNTINYQSSNLLLSIKNKRRQL